MKRVSSDTNDGPAELGANQPGDSAPVESTETGLPFLHTWKAVYLFVVVTFALWVVLLIVLTRSFA
jgi:hypothetical protein